MNKALPWNVNGVGFDARDAAREAAHRQGKSLGEWLHGVIADHAADLGVNADEMGGQQRIHAVTSKLEHLSARGMTEHERRPRAGRTLEGARRRAAWNDRDDDLEARDDTAPLRRRREKPSADATELLLEEAIEAMERRAVRAEQRTDNALQSFTRLLERTEAERDRERDSVAVLAKKLTDIEARLTDKLSQEGNDPIKGALARLESRLETFGQQTEMASVPSTRQAAAPTFTRETHDAGSYAAARMRVRGEDVPAPEASPKTRAPLTRLEAKLNSILGGTSAPGPAAYPARVSVAPTPASWVSEPSYEAAPSEDPRAAQPEPAPVPERRPGRSLASRLTPPHAAPMFEAAASETPASVTPAPQTAAPPAEAVPTQIPTIADGSAALAAILNGNRRLGPAIAEITRRQRTLDAQPASQFVVRPSTAAPSAALVRSEGVQLAGLQSEIANLTSSIENLRRDVAGQRRSRARALPVDKIHTETVALADQVRDLAGRSAVSGLETSIQSLADSVAISRAKSPQSKVLTPVESVVPDLRKTISKLDAGTALADLEKNLRTLAVSISGLPRDGVSAAALSALRTQVDELRETVGAVDSRPRTIEMVQTRIDALVARLERLRRHPNSKQDIRGDVDALRQLISEPHSNAYGKAQTQIETIEAMLADMVVDRDNSVVGVEPTSTAPLEHLVRELSNKLDAVQLPGAGTEALDALQKQIAVMSDRFEQSQDGFSKLSSLEDAMQQLFRHLESTRSSVEQAAALAAREVLRIASQNKLDSEFEAKIGLEAFNALQDDAAARTKSTLSAVQGSLDDIVSRLSSMEAEIAEVRTGPRGPNGDREKAQELSPSQIQERAEGRIRERIQERRDEPAKVRDEQRVDTGSPEESATAEAPPATAIANSILDQILGHRPGNEPAKTTAKSAVPAKAKTNAGEADEDSRADFIAAARRAAMVAQADLADLKRPSQTASPKAIRAGLRQQSRDYVSRHKRPVLLSMAALFVIAGALTIIKLGATDEGESRVADVASSMKTARLDAPSNATSGTKITDGKTADGPKASTLAANMPPVSSTDATPTGSVVPLPSFAAASLPRPAVASLPSAISPAMQKKAEAGDSAAQYALGLQYADGNGVLRDFAQAAHWYQKAADQNVAPAQYRLASLYEKGLGVTQDKIKAKALYLKAAEAGNPRAMHNLAVLLADGDGKPDYDGAATWFRKAAQYGIHDSQYNLGILLARGIGVKQSLIQSYQWFAIAAAQGDTDAAKKRDEVGSRLRANDIAVASALASAFHPRAVDAAATEVPMPAGGWDSVQPASPVNSPRPKISAL